MRRIVLFAMSTITTLVLLFSYHTSTNSGSATGATVIQTPATTQAAPGPTATPATPTPAATTSSPAATTPAAKAATGGTFTGDTVSTQWGPVQVKITVVSGRITASEAVQHPQGNRRDQEINAYALPVLDAAVVQAQSANLDAVSGATVTSDGYIASLQSAIDQAHL